MSCPDAPSAAHPDIGQLLAGLRERLTDLGHTADCRSQTERAAWYTTYGTLSTTISQLQNPVDPKLAKRLAYWRSLREAWLAKESELVASIHDQVSGDEVGGQHAQRALTLLRKGNLTSGPGTTYGTLDALDQLLRELEEKRDHAQQLYDTAVERAVSLVGAPRETTA